MMPELIGNPRGERDTKPVADRHHVLRNADRLVRHVRIIHTYQSRASRPNTGSPRCRQSAEATVRYTPESASRSRRECLTDGRPVTWVDAPGAGRRIGSRAQASNSSSEFASTIRSPRSRSCRRGGTRESHEKGQTIAKHNRCDSDHSVDRLAATRSRSRYVPHPGATAPRAPFASASYHSPSLGNGASPNTGLAPQSCHGRSMMTAIVSRI